MTRVIKFEMEVTDAEAEAFLKRFATQAQAIINDADGGEESVVDDRGVPWNPDYHASTKTKTKDGVWKRRKGVDSADIDRYEHPFITSASSAPSVPDTENVDIPPFLQRAAPPVAPSAPVAPTMPTMPTMPSIPTPAAQPIVTYNDMMTVFQAACEKHGGELVQTRVMTEFYPACGVDNPEKLVTDETMRAALVSLIKQNFPV